MQQNSASAHHGATDRGFRFEGTNISQNAQPLQGLIVTIAETGDSAVTDSSGSFVVTTVQVVGNIQLLVENGGASSSATGQEIPADASVVAVDLKLNTDTDTCDVEEVRIGDRS